ncbi:MAG: UDP-N-acetylmuramoyl-L-alanyl-D-glutamate--2,6-diaminopimelate ligase [Brevinematales bacterium]|nr:UDP-N-acetylmuramoyl-L-alanyl-D-glutamate--2,6-diaminopimelate ligase [Brevinematales bacterium]
MKLKSLLKSVENFIINSHIVEDTEIKNLSEDSREDNINSNTLFFAIEGSKVDATKFIPELISRGCKTFITNKLINLENNNVNLIIVNNIRRVQAILSKEFFQHPDEKLRIIGVTGTKGKTTVSYMVFNALRGVGKNGGLIGTIEYRINDYSINADNTTPGPLYLFSLLNEIVNVNGEFVSMEVSSHGLETDRVYGLKFDAGIFTNLSREHLDFHQTMENYFNAKMKLFHQIKNTNPNGIAVINIDTDWGQKAYNVVKELGIRLITCGISKRADIMAKDVTISIDGNSFSLDCMGKKFSVRTNMVGIHNIYNALCSISALVGVFGDEKIEEYLHHIGKTTVPGRFQTVKSDKGFYVVIDYAHTPDSLEKTLETARSFSPKILTVVFGAGGDRDKGKRPLMGEIASRIADKVIITSDNPRTENPISIIDDIIQGIPENLSHKVRVVADRKIAIQTALKEAVEGEIIVVAGKGHETYQIIGTEKIHFSDYEEVISSQYF